MVIASIRIKIEWLESILWPIQDNYLTKNSKLRRYMSLREKYLQKYTCQAKKEKLLSPSKIVKEM